MLQRSIKMNESVQTLLAILALVGGALASSLDGTSQQFLPKGLDESVEPFVPDETAKETCLRSFEKGLNEITMPRDIELMMNKLNEENPARPIEYSVQFGLENQRKPESCDLFTDKIDSLERLHCKWFDDHPKIARHITNVLLLDPHIKSVLFAGHACSNLKTQEQFRRKKLSRAISQLKVPNDIVDLMKKKKVMKRWTVRKRDRLVAKSCVKFFEEAASILEVARRQYELEEELYNETLLKDLLADKNFIPIMYASEFCDRLITTMEGSQTASKRGSPQASILNHY